MNAAATTTGSQAPPLPAFSAEHTARSLSIHCAASLANIDAADALMSAFMARIGPRINLFALRVLMREAMLNAVTHGSNTDPSREVRLYLSLDKDAVALAVEDDGPGFQWQRFGEDWDIEGPSGRGLALMRSYASSMTFNTLGNRVELRRCYEDSPGATSSGS